MRGPFSSDAAKGKDGDGSGEAAGFGEGFEAGGGGDASALEGFAEDWGEEDEVGLLGASGEDVFGGVAGDGDCWLGGLGVAVEGADLSRGEFGRVRGEMDAVEVGGEGDVGAGGDEDAGFRVGGADGGEDRAAEGGEPGCGNIFFADEEVVEAFGGELGAAGC